MEIQLAASTTAAAAGTGTASGTNGASAGNGAAAGNGFSATLKGLIAAVPSGDAANTQVMLPTLPALIQLVTNASNQGQAVTEVKSEDLLKQLDALINLLNANDDEAKQLLENPDVQAWLAQLQLLLAVTPTPAAVSEALPVTGAKGENQTSVPQVQGQVQDAQLKAQQTAALNPVLFVPLETAADQNNAVQLTQAASLKPISKEEAVELLGKFKQAVQKDPTSAAAKTIQRALTSMLPVQQQPLLQVANVSNDVPLQAASTGTAPVIPQALEMLAAKTLPPKLEAQSTVSSDEQLFEPLMDMQASSNDTQAMPLHEYVKQVSAGTHVAKPPVLLANAPTFAEDMTQFVVKSFTMNVIAEGVTEAKLSLYPQHLGQVDVKLTMQNGQLIAQFMADSVAGKEMLESQLTQLRTTLLSQGIQVQKLEVTQNQAFQSGMFQEQRQQQSQQSSKQQKGNGTNKVLSLEEEIAQAASAPTQAQTISTGIRQTSIDTTA
ncbi:flagellar hook-length control protein FliK [Paenibacillus rigui]|uniref:Flagellar hook-length control protein-like C-terminal domain-containing protein n=1 Tax=Paenibacillus rigui TaxID=554312 RepID=A0A229UMR8_9BACL|nr:flagellar hook-length control protein FliK [Paenibacillus rigui]OXM84671.1 hypothetical protein CF651_19395 [Paenibacillus rigui]